jgi:hypothetical protein
MAQQVLHSCKPKIITGRTGKAVDISLKSEVRDGDLNSDGFTHRYFCLCFTLFHAAQNKAQLTQTILNRCAKAITCPTHRFYNTSSDTDKLYFEDKIEQFLDAVH